MANIEKKFDEFFDIEPVEKQPLPSTQVDFNGFDQDFKNDYDVARSNLHELIEKGKGAIDDILAIAKESEKARDFEVAATLLQNIMNANQQLVDLHKKIRDITHQKNTINNTEIKNTTLFVGSTSELSKILKDINDDMIDIN